MHETVVATPRLSPDAYHQKRLLVLRTTLLALGWNRALRCLEYALVYHTGFRKDGVTPEYLHQVEQALFALSLRSLLKHPEKTVCVILLHDTLEDHYVKGVRLADIRRVGGKRVAKSVELMTNNVLGVEKPKRLYFSQMAFDIMAAFAKACDRMNNQYTLPGASKTDAKMRAKIAETVDHILPMLKAARRRFPEQENAFQIVKTILEQQLRLLEHAVVPEA